MEAWLHRRYLPGGGSTREGTWSVWSVGCHAPGRGGFIRGSPPGYGTPSGSWSLLRRDPAGTAERPRGKGAAAHGLSSRLGGWNRARNRVVLATSARKRAEK